MSAVEKYMELHEKLRNAEMGDEEYFATRLEMSKLYRGMSSSEREEALSRYNHPRRGRDG